MPDREKVIKGIEHCIGDDCNGDKWSECEYSGHGCIDALLKDALALLKAQEPVKRKPYDSFDYLCGNCLIPMINLIGLSSAMGYSTTHRPSIR